MRFRVHATPHERLRFADVVLVVDVLRATTTATALFDEGLTTLVLAEGCESALNLRRNGEPLIGEVGGLRPDGFDFGNSPLEVRGRGLGGKTAVLATSNGTKAAHLAARSSGSVLLACLNNAAAAARLAAGSADKEVAILCAGNAGGASLDDLYTAGALAARLVGLGLTPAGDDAEAALILHHTNLDPLPLLTEVGAHLERIGLGADVVACAQLDVSERVGVMRSARGAGLVFTAR